MPLYAFNLTVAPVTLAGITPVKTIPASSAVGVRSVPVNVTTDLRGLSSAAYAALQAQVAAASVTYEWTNGYAEYATDSMQVTRAPAANLYLPAEPTRSVVTIYARSTGSDATGNGTLANPYRTFVRAIRDVPLVIRGTNYIVDITGIGTENLPAGWQMPPFQGDGGSWTNLAPPVPLFNRLTPLMILAAPTLDTTILAANRVADVTNAITDLHTLQTNLALTPHALRGKFVEQQYYYAPIADNTATDIEVAGGYGFPAGDVGIYTLSATLNQADAAVFLPTVEIGDASINIGFYGISFQTASASAASLVAGSGGHGRIPTFIRTCAFDGLAVMPSSPVWLGYVYIERLYAFYGINCYNTGCVIYGATITDPLGGMESTQMYFGYGVIDTCSKMGTPVSTSFATPYSGETWFKGCEIRNCPAEGIKLYGGVHTLEHCYIHNNVGVGVLLDGAKTAMHACLLKDNGGNGITAKNLSFIQMDTVTGTGNTGYGLQISSGSQVSAATSCTVTGTVNAIKIGDNAAGVWPVAGNYTDVAADKVEFARLLTY